MIEQVLSRSIYIYIYVWSLKIRSFHSWKWWWYITLYTFWVLKYIYIYTKALQKSCILFIFVEISVDTESAIILIDRPDFLGTKHFLRITIGYAFLPAINKKRRCSAYKSRPKQNHSLFSSFLSCPENICVVHLLSPRWHISSDEKWTTQTFSW